MRASDSESLRDVNCVVLGGLYPCDPGGHAPLVARRRSRVKGRGRETFLSSLLFTPRARFHVDRLRSSSSLLSFPLFHGWTRRLCLPGPLRDASSYYCSSGSRVCLSPRAERSAVTPALRGLCTDDRRRCKRARSGGALAFGSRVNSPSPRTRHRLIAGLISRATDGCMSAGHPGKNEVQPEVEAEANGVATAQPARFHPK